MHVEDFLLAIADALTRNNLSRSRRVAPFGGLFDDTWYRGFIASVAQSVRTDRPLSSNQSRIILKMIRHARPYLVESHVASGGEIDATLAAPTHRHPPYTSSSVPREARYIGDNLLAIRCKADPVITDTIKALGRPPSEAAIGINLLRTRPRFDWTYKIWIVPVYRFNLPAISVLLREHRFRLDQTITDYLARCAECANAASFVTFADIEHNTLRAAVADDYVLARWITELAGGIAL